MMEKKIFDIKEPNFLILINKLKSVRIATLSSWF